MKRLAFFLALMAAPLVAHAQSVFSGSPYPIPYYSWADPSSLTNTNNLLIQKINGFLLPQFPQTGGSNYPEFYAGTTTGPTISSAAEAVRIGPSGNNNIVLFPSDVGSASNYPGATSTGVLKVGNLASWIPAPGLAVCPGQNPAAGPPLWGPYETGNETSNLYSAAMGHVVTGYLVVRDWLDRMHGVPAC